MNMAMDCPGQGQDEGARADIVDDRDWFAARPRRRFRLRPPTAAELEIAGPELGGHVVVEKITSSCRARHRLAIEGPEPEDTDGALGKLLRASWGRRA